MKSIYCYRVTSIDGAIQHEKYATSLEICMTAFQELCKTYHDSFHKIFELEPNGDAFERYTILYYFKR